MQLIQLISSVILIVLASCNSKEKEIKRLNKEISNVLNRQTVTFKSIQSLEEAYRLVRYSASPEKVAELKELIEERERRSDTLASRLNSLNRLVDSLQAQ